MLIVLESSNNDVGWITLVQDNSEVSCMKKNGDVIATYGGVECEFVTLNLPYISALLIFSRIDPQKECTFIM